MAYIFSILSRNKIDNSSQIGFQKYIEDFGQKYPGAEAAYECTKTLTRIQYRKLFLKKWG
ncbi:MAG: hypothetical protein K2G55_03620 [Lachnospiraceae bacterium]|nr:hypothetical protein [Lachnospiraceae bacterium]